MLLKFGEVSTDAQAHIEVASVDQLEHYIARLLTAGTPEAVFDPSV